MLKTYTLKNGIKVVTYEIPQMRSVFLSQAVKGGSIFDQKETNGAAHFMEHILVQAIPSFPNVEALTDFVEKLAGSYNAMTGSQFIKFIMNSPSNSLEDVLKIGYEVFFEPLFPEDSIERERNAVLEEIHQRQDALWYKIYKFFAEVRFKSGHPLLLDGGGSQEAVTKLQKQDLVDYWSKFFHPKNTYIVLVGNFKSEKAKQLLEEIYGKNKSKDNFIGFPNFTNAQLSSRKVAIRHDDDLKTCYIDLSFPTVSNEAPLFDRIVEGVARTMLGGLRSSRLHRLLRQRRGLVYGVSIGSNNYEKFGFVQISTQAIAENMEEVIKLIVAELKGFVEDGPTSVELEFAKNYLINRSLMSFDSPGGVASWIEGDLMWEDKIYTPEEYVKVIEKVTLKDILKFMQKNWDFAKLNLVVQGAISDTPENVQKLQDLVKELK